MGLSNNVTVSLWPRMKGQRLSYKLSAMQLYGAKIYEHIIKPAEEERFQVFSAAAAELVRALSEPVHVLTTHLGPIMADGSDAGGKDIDWFLRS